MKQPLIERVLSPVADVRRHEAASALLMTLLVFLLLGAYYLMKTAREILILTEGGAEVKSYSSAGQALLLLLIVPAYGALASRVSRVRLVGLVTLFFASNLVLFIVAIAAGLHVGVVYFLWVGIFNLMVIAQFWAYAADLYARRPGKAAVSVDRRWCQPRRVAGIGAGGGVGGDQRVDSPSCGRVRDSRRVRGPRADRRSADRGAPPGRPRARTEAPLGERRAALP